MENEASASLIQLLFAFVKHFNDPVALVILLINCERTDSDSSVCENTPFLDYPRTGHGGTGQNDIYYGIVHAIIE
jgi:hypothetical protein